MLFWKLHDDYLLVFYQEQYLELCGLPWTGSQ